jgi:hypothetical protein
MLKRTKARVIQSQEECERLRKKVLRLDERDKPTREDDGMALRKARAKKLAEFFQLSGSFHRNRGDFVATRMRLTGLLRTVCESGRGRLEW